MFMLSRLHTELSGAQHDKREVGKVRRVPPPATALRAPAPTAQLASPVISQSDIIQPLYNRVLSDMEEESPLVSLLCPDGQESVAVGEQTVHFALVTMFVGQNNPLGLVHLHKTNGVGV